MTRHKPIDTLRLTQTERDLLIDGLEKSARDSRVEHEGRTHERVGFNTKNFPVTFTHPGGVETRCLVTARNLSIGGLGFLHGGFLHANTACAIELPTIFGDSRVIRGAVRSCRHVAGKIHEIGVRFDAPIDPYEFLEPGDAPQGGFDSKLDASSLSGRVLAIEPAASDARLLVHQFASTSATLEIRSDFEEARELIQSGAIDLILISDAALGTNGGADISQAIRMEGFDGPLIALTAESRSEWLAQVRKHHFAEVLVKPCDIGKFYACLAQNLPDTGQASTSGKIYSEIALTEAAVELLGGFLKEVELAVREVNTAMAKGDKSTIRALCLGLKGNGRGYGFPRLSDAAREIVDAIDKSAPADDVEVALKRLELVFQRLSPELPPAPGAAPA